MSCEDVFESLVEQRIAQLEKVSERRNALLREMFQILRRRDNVGAVLTIDDEDEDDLHVFLNKCDLRTNPETGYIGHLPDNELFSLIPAKPPPSSPASSTSRPPSSRNRTRSRSKSVLSDFGDVSASPGHLSKIPEASTVAIPTPRPPVDHGDSDDELNLIDSPPACRSPSIVSIHIENTPEPLQTESVSEEVENPEEQSDVMQEEESKEVEEIVVEPTQEVGDTQIKEMVPEESVQEDEQDAEAEDVHRMIEEEEKQLDETAENPAEPASSSLYEPISVPEDTLPIVPTEPTRENEEDVVMDERVVEVEVEVEVSKETTPAVEDTPPIQNEQASDEEPMVLDSSPLQPPRSLSETPAHAISPSTSTDVPEVLAQSRSVSPPIKTDANRMDVDPEPTEQPDEMEINEPLDPIEAPAQSEEVSQLATEPERHELTPPPREPSPPRPIRSSVPPLPSEYNYGTPEPIVLADPPPPVFIKAPTLPPYSGFGKFDLPTDLSSLHPPTSPKSPSQSQPRHPLGSDYPLPPVDSLPIEFSRKKRLKQQKKKEREREKGEVKREKDKEKDKDGGKDGGNDWAPWGVNRWIATIKTNPVHKKVSKATKCLTTRDWSVAMQELKLLRTMDRIEMLKSTGRWSFRQPKKQRGVGGLTKTHWDYLMDEMKWMRTDFREERKWKMALAYNLSTAVLEWHAAGTLERRLKRGICVLWKPPRQDKDHVQQPEGASSQLALDPMELEAQDPSSQDQSQGQAEQSLFGLDYGSDEDDDEDQDKDQQSVADALDTTTIVEDSLDAAEQERSQDQDKDDNGLGEIDLKDLEPKKEALDDLANLQMPPPGMDVDVQTSTQETQQAEDENMDQVSGSEQNVVKAEPAHSGLRSSSNNPILGNGELRKSNSSSSDPPMIPQSKTSRKNLYAPLRERIAYSDVDKLFLDLDDFHITTPNHNPSNDAPETQHLLPPADLSDIFPDLQPYTLLDVSPSGPPVEERKGKDKKSDRDDPNKRIEEAAYTKIYPASKFIHMKPTLIGALQPATHFKEGQWVNLDETPINVELDVMPVRITEDFSGGLFDHRMVPPQIYTALSQPVQSHWMSKDQNGKPREPKRVEHQWNTNDDALLRSLVDKYLNNWELIAESFNAISQTVKTDKRTSRDCQERWKERWGQDRRIVPEAPSALDSTPPPQVVPATPNQITTRGVKRGASTSVSSPAGMSTEPSKKRRRHTLMQDLVRKAAKKRAEALQKINARKPPITHESHAAYNKMPKMTPAELSRSKAEREASDQQYQLRVRAQQLQQVQQAQQAQQMQQQQQQQQQQQNGTQGRVTPTAQTNGTGQVQAQQPTVAVANASAGTAVSPPNGVARTSTSGLQTQGPSTVPQIRSAQVPISGQQRSNTPMLTGNTRLTQQQIIRAQQQALSQALAAQMQAQQQAQASASGNGTNVNGTGVQAAGQNGQPQGQVAVNMNGNMNGNGNSSMSPPYTATATTNTSRDATSSPAVPHGSPPRTSGTPTNANGNGVNSPRPGSAQAQGQQQQGGQASQGQNQNQGGTVQMQQPQQLAAMLQSVQQNGQIGLSRATNVQGHYYLPGYTPEQLQSIMRLHALQQQQQQQHVQQQQQQHQQQQ
ncbi:hypothetical protein K435DRAFT_741376 [Dendrothele bispora CBS 962.96]|uniref:Vacuolar import and degradation protein 21 n=1 Tax=Dendrothele bispora (strain CBS 962.96) TaxID=1314807 RepID=A0A4S8MX13_DENBC|nr:hypothetical protein K435DRAFT_741376 [Dendrothele bispora CBS 962.96]